MLLKLLTCGECHSSRYVIFRKRTLRVNQARNGTLDRRGKGALRGSWCSWAGESGGLQDAGPQQVMLGSTAHLALQCLLPKQGCSTLSGAAVSPGRHRCWQTVAERLMAGFPSGQTSDSWGGNPGGGCRDRVRTAAGLAGGCA